MRRGFSVTGSPASKLPLKKCKVSHACEAMDRERYMMRRKIHILKLEWDWAAQLTHTR